MPKIVLLDTGVLSFLIHPREDISRPLLAWVLRLLATDTAVVVPEIADYELRRELVRARREESVQRLDEIGALLGYLPITTAIMRQAAQHWAIARQQGRPTTDDAALDGDMILTATATTIPAGDPVMIATTNTRHLSMFCDARAWSEIS